MNISQVKIRRLYGEGRMKALVSVTIDDDFAVHDIKVIEGPQRVFVAMPSRKEDGGNFRDVVHPITKDARDQMEKTILDHYYMALDENYQKDMPSEL